MQSIIKKIGYLRVWKWHKNGYFYPIIPYRPGLRADKNFNVFGGDPITATVAAVSGVGLISGNMAANRQKSAASKAEDLANQQMADAKAEQARLEEKYGLTPGELAREQRLYGIPEGDEAIKFATGSLGLEPKQQTELERRAGMSGEELLKEVGPQTKQLLETVAQRQGMTGEELFKSEGAIPTELQAQVLKDVQNPGGNYVNTLNQQLELSRQMVNAEANKRGVFGGTPEGGIRFENLGRAGVDLAIKSATATQDARQQDLANASTLATLFQNLSAGARSDASTVAAAGESEAKDARTQLADFLTMMENASASSKNRAATVGMGASSQTQNVINQGYDTLQEVNAYRGTIPSGTERALNAVGQLGSSYAGSLGTPTASPIATPSSYDELMSTQSKGVGQFETLGGISGSEMAAFKKKYPGFAN